MRGTDGNQATSADPKDAYMKALVTTDLVVRGRGHVQTHFSTNPTIDSSIDFVF